MSSEITTAAELKGYTPGSVFTARSGEVWMLERVHTMGSTDYLCAHLTSPETPHTSSTDVLRKWGPLTPQWRPDRPAPPDVASIVRFLVEGRREYQRDNPDEYLAGQVNGSDRILTILTADPESDGWKTAVGGWLPSWHWPGFDELWQQAHRPAPPTTPIAPKDMAPPTVQPAVETLALHLQEYWARSARRREPIIWADLARDTLALIGGRTEAEVKADALEEAAGASMEWISFKPDGWGSNPVDQSAIAAMSWVLDWLRARAAAIRGEQS